MYLCTMTKHGENDVDDSALATFEKAIKSSSQGTSNDELSGSEEGDAVVTFKTWIVTCVSSLNSA